MSQLVGNAQAADRIDVRKYISNEVGEPTLRDIIAELKKPGRDPRAVFEKPAFRDDVTTIDDVKEGMTLEGVVTNVTAFGAFVDIGIHQDGLVHVSELADRFIRDPSEVVKTGDKIKVRVLAVDKARNRVSLTCRSGTSAPRQYAGGPRPQSGAGRGGSSRGGGRSYSSSVCNANRGKIEGLDNEENLLAVGPRMRRSCLEVSGLFPMVSVA